MLKQSLTTLSFSELQNQIWLLELNRPEARNAMNTKMMKELRQVWHHCGEFQNQVRVIILTGKGSAFCAGADLKERKQLSQTEWNVQRTILIDAMQAMMSCPQPILAAVNGPAFGGGCELVLACDFAYADATATFALPEVKLGLIPGAMGTQWLPRTTGLKRAKELCLTGQAITAIDALEFGIVNKISAQDQLITDMIQTAQRIADNAPLAVQQAKKALNMAERADYLTGFYYENEAYNTLLTTDDRVEGILAFNEKRAPRFTGR